MSRPPILALLVLLGALTPAQTSPWHRDYRPSEPFPPELELSPDWYRRTSSDDAPERWRTNHSLATIRFNVTATTRVGLRFAQDQITAPGLKPGFCAWRLFAGQTLLREERRHSLMSAVFAEGLEPDLTHRLEVTITLPLDPDSDPAALSQVERWREGVGQQGAFVDLLGLVVDDAAKLLPLPAPPRPWLDYLVYGDSLADGGVMEPDGGPEGDTPYRLNAAGAAAGWPAKAVRRACELLEAPRTARGINHSFGGWWGCRLAFPLHGIEDETRLRALQPWMAPNFFEMPDRCHPGAPRFGIDTVDLVVYALAQNDQGTGRLKEPGAYVADLHANIDLIRKTWPGARILVAATHVSDKPSGKVQQALMERALMSPGYDHRRDPELHFTSLTRILYAHGLLPQRTHPPERIHDLWAEAVAEEIRDLLQAK
ncbi:MAG: SGNH/GDSL hydrolase family protein [Planctomycetes bacterium]|nr:SGNH/GDSL hydrolase family protein [Planctomycetota bacterium]